MKAIMPDFDHESKEPVYIQLFAYIRDSILCGETVPGEKLPSLRNLSESLGISITTVSLAYEQLEVEGYITSRPRSGYYVSDMHLPSSFVRSRVNSADDTVFLHSPEDETSMFEAAPDQESNDAIYDLSSFDFVKWKKCVSKILTDHPQELLFESDPQGEQALRTEIAKYIYTSRGVRCRADQIVIAAGTQQITALLALLLRRAGIEHVAVEDPGYEPVITSFRDHNFALTKVPVEPDGIRIEKLPANIRTAAYVNPSNQFPTGAVMPISRRHMLLEWADTNDSFIIEDDYDSELRYTGRPIPAMQGLDVNNRVIYLGSFSSTLFAAVKISYMVMPPAILHVFEEIRSTYTQTCSKTEQLTLALFMEKGHYQTGIKKMRRLYSQKLHAVLEAFEGHDDIRAVNTDSGINLILEITEDTTTGNTAAETRQNALLKTAAHLGIKMTSIAHGRLMMKYNQIPLDRIPELIDDLF